jgi:hypothetical protein
VNDQELLTLYDQQQRIAIDYPDMRKESLPEVVRFVRPAPGMSSIAYHRADDTRLDAVIQAQIDYFAPQGLRFTWPVYEHDTPANLKERLMAHGFEPDNDPGAVMVLAVAEAPAALLEPITIDVRRLTQVEQLDVIVQVEQEVWGGDFSWIRQRLGNHLSVPGYLEIYAAYVDDQPACTAWVYFHLNSQFAGLFGGATLPRQRQRGLYTAVLAARVQAASRRGYRFVTTTAGPMSRPILARHGFRQLTTVDDFEWKGQVIS